MINSPLGSALEDIMLRAQFSIFGVQLLLGIFGKKNRLNASGFVWEYLCGLRTWSKRQKMRLVF